MNRVRTYFAAAVAAIILSLAVAACSTQAKSTTDSPADAPEAISITTAVVESRPLDRFLPSSPRFEPATRRLLPRS